MNDTKTGMPAQTESNFLLDLLLDPADSFRFSEERRLFYVAITRARLHTFCIANPKHPSCFLLEICPELKEQLQG